MPRVVVMHPTGIQLESGYQDFRWVGEVSEDEYQAIFDLDERAGRECRLLRVDEPKKRGRPKKND